MVSSFTIYAVLSTLLVLGASNPYNYYSQPGYYHQQWRQQPDAPIQYLPPDHEWQIRNYHQPIAQTHRRAEVVKYKPVEDYPVYSEAYSSAGHNMHHPHSENHMIKKVIVPVTGGSQILNLPPNGDSQEVKITQVISKNDGTYDDTGLPEVVKQALAKFLAKEKNNNNHTHAFTIIAHDDVILQQPDSNAGPANPVHQHPVLKHHNRGQIPYKTRITPVKKTVKTTVIATGANDMTVAGDDDVETIAMSLNADTLAMLKNAEGKVIPGSNQENAAVIPQAHQLRHTVQPIPASAHKPMPVSVYKPIPMDASHMPGHVLPHKPTSSNFDSYSSGKILPAKESDHMLDPAHKPTPVHDHKTNNAFKHTPNSILEHKPAASHLIVSDEPVTSQSRKKLPETNNYHSSYETSPTEKLKHRSPPIQKPTLSHENKNKPTHAKPTQSSVGGHKLTLKPRDSNDAPVTPKSGKPLPKSDDSKLSNTTSTTEKEKHVKEPTKKSTPVLSYGNIPTHAKPTNNPVVGIEPTDKHVSKNAPVTPKSEKDFPHTDDSDSEEFQHTKKPPQNPTPVPGYTNIPSHVKPTHEPKKHDLNDLPDTPKSEKQLPESDNSNSSEKTLSTAKYKPTKPPTSVPGATNSPTHIKPTQSCTTNKHDTNDARVTPKSKNNLPPKADDSDYSDEMLLTEKETTTKKPAQKATPVPDTINSPNNPKATQNSKEAPKLTPSKLDTTRAPVISKSGKHSPESDYYDSSSAASPTEKDEPTKTPAQKPPSVPGYNNSPNDTKPTQSYEEGHTPTPYKYNSSDAPVTPKSVKHLSKPDDSKLSDKTSTTKKGKPTKVPAVPDLPINAMPTQIPGIFSSNENNGPVTPKSEKYLPGSDDSDSCEETSPTEQVKPIKESAEEPTPVSGNNYFLTHTTPSQNSEERHTPTLYNSNDAPVTPTSENHLSNSDDYKSSDETSNTEKEKPTKESAQKRTEVPSSPTNSTFTQSPEVANKSTPNKRVVNDGPVTQKSEKHLPEPDNSDSCEETSLTEQVKPTKEPAQKPTPVPGYINSPTHTKNTYSSGGLTPTPNKYDSNYTAVTLQSDKHLPKSDHSKSSDETSTSKKENPTKEPTQKPTAVPGSPAYTIPTQSPGEANKNNGPITPKSKKHLTGSDYSDSCEETPPTEQLKFTQKPTPTPDFINSPAYSKTTQSPGIANNPTPDKQIVNDSPVTSKSESYLPKTDGSDEIPLTDKEKPTQVPAQKSRTVPSFTNSSIHTESWVDSVGRNKPTPKKHDSNDSPANPKPDKHLPESDDSDSCEETTPTEPVKFTEKPAQKPTLAPVYDYIPAHAEPPFSPAVENKPAPDKHGIIDTLAAPKSEKDLPEFDDSDSCERSPTQNEKHAKAQRPTPVPGYNNSPTYTKPTQTPGVANKPAPKSEKVSPEIDETNFSDEISSPEKVKHSTELAQKPTAVPGNNTPHAKTTQSSVEGHKPTSYNQVLNDAPVTPESDTYLPESDDADSSEQTSPSKEIKPAKEPAPKTTPVAGYSNIPKSKDFNTDMFDDLFPIFQIEASDHSGKKYIIKCENPFIPVDECDGQLIIVTSEEPSYQSKKDSAKDANRHSCCGLQDKKETDEKTISSKQYKQESDTVRNEKDISDNRKVNDAKEDKDVAAETADEKQEKRKILFDDSDTKKTYIENEVKKHVYDSKKVSSLTSHCEEIESVVNHEETETEVKHTSIEDENSQQRKSKDKSLQARDSEKTEVTTKNATQDSDTEPVNPISYIVSVIRRALNRNYAINQLFRDPGVKKVVQRTFTYEE